MNRSLALGAALFALHASLFAADLSPGDFRWEATLDTAGRSGLVRLPLPADALGRLQSSVAADLRVFDGQGQPVPFALATPPAPEASARRSTHSLPALPL